MRPVHIAYSLLGFFFVAEGVLRRGKEAKSMQEGPADRGSTRAIGAAFGWSLLAMLVAPFLNQRRVGHLRSERPAWSGVTIMLIGLVLRIWSSLVLGSFYTRTLRTAAGQHLISEGPYRLVRHPGYLGDILLWLGAGIATANWIMAVAITLPMLRAYRYRIRVEEAMLADAFPQEYQSYASRTWRLIPFIY